MITKEELEKRVNVEVYPYQYFVAYPYRAYDSGTGWFKLCQTIEEAHHYRKKFIEYFLWFQDENVDESELVLSIR